MTDLDEQTKGSFDYTEWQRTLFEGVPLDKLLKDAMDFRLNHQD